MTPQLMFFPVHHPARDGDPGHNGDMTLLELESGRRVLIDVHIDTAADDDSDAPNVAQMLRDRLKRDSQGRKYVDAFLLSHPDEDHCKGLDNHFHLGPPDTWSKEADKILIREIWSSPMVFRRASTKHVLCPDAKAFKREAKRRVKRFRESGNLVSGGDRIQILGEDESGKTDDLTAILVKVDEEFSQVDGSLDPSLKTRLLGPLPKASDESEEEALAKNRSSTILRFTLTSTGREDACLFLTGGDAEVAVWERLWQRHYWRAGWLRYDIILTPHHCSWRSLSYDSWSEKGEDAEVCSDARSALSQTRSGAEVLASSKPITDDDSDPPCVRAQREYEAIATEAGGLFRRIGDSKKPLRYEILWEGPRRVSERATAAGVTGGGAIGGQPLIHG